MSKLQSFICVYLVHFNKNGEILLSLRQNTSFEDGNWSMVAGHAEESETAYDAIIRESYEEIGITINKSDLDAIYFMDRKSMRQNIDIFFRCTKYSGIIENMESHKCGGLDYFAIDQIPINTVSYIKQAIDDIKNGIIFREFGY